MFRSYKLDKFGICLREIRRSQKLTQKDVKHLIGINEDTLRKIENGMVIPKYETIELLSELYRTDLLKVLIESRSSQLWYNISQSIDSAIVRNDIDELQTLLEHTVQLGNEKLQNELLVLEQSQQFSLFLTCAIAYLSRSQPVDVILLSIENALKLTQPEFSFDSFKSLNFNLFEYRILLLIGILVAHTGDLNLSNDIFEFVYNNIKSETKYNNEVSKLLVKVVTNLAYNYHLLDNSETCLYWCELGIKCCIQEKSMYCLPQLLFRKGIAQLRYDKDQSLETLKHAILLLEISHEHELAEIFRNSARNEYGIEF